MLVRQKLETFAQGNRYAFYFSIIILIFGLHPYGMTGIMHHLVFVPFLIKTIYVFTKVYKTSKEMKDTKNYFEYEKTFKRRIALSYINMILVSLLLIFRFIYVLRIPNEIFKSTITTILAIIFILIMIICAINGIRIILFDIHLRKKYNEYKVDYFIDPVSTNKFLYRNKGEVKDGFLNTSFKNLILNIEVFISCFLGIFLITTEFNINTYLIIGVSLLVLELVQLVLFLSINSIRKKYTLKSILTLFFASFIFYIFVFISMYIIEITGINSADPKELQFLILIAYTLSFPWFKASMYAYFGVYNDKYQNLFKKDEVKIDNNNSINE